MKEIEVERAKRRKKDARISNPPTVSGGNVSTTHEDEKGKTRDNPHVRETFPEREKGKTRGTISVRDAAAIMGVSPQFLRVALQQNKFPFGVAVKMKRWAYFINPDKFDDYLQDRKVKGCQVGQA